MFAFNEPTAVRSRLLLEVLLLLRCLFAGRKLAQADRLKLHMNNGCEGILTVSWEFRCKLPLICIRSWAKPL